MVPSMSRATWRIWRRRGVGISGSMLVVLHYLQRAFRQRFEEGAAILFGEDAVIQHDDDAGVGFGTDEPAHALAEFENRFGQREFAESVAAAGFDGFDA